MKRNRPYLEMLGVLIILMIKYHGCAAPRERALIGLKQVI